MKELTVGTTTILVSDDIADAVVEYAVALSESGDADQIELTDAPSGAPVTVVLSAGESVVSRAVSSGEVSEPDGSETLAYIEGRLALGVDAAPVIPASTAVDSAVLDAEKWMQAPDGHTPG